MLEFINQSLQLVDLFLFIFLANQLVELDLRFIGEFAIS